MMLPRRRTFVASSVFAAIAAVMPARAAGDPFSAMRVRRVSPPVPAAHVVLHGMDGRPIPLSGFRGKVVLLEFFLPT
jgi:hypothetical protein